MKTNRLFVRLNSVVAILAAMFYLLGVAMADPQHQHAPEPDDSGSFTDDGTPTFTPPQKPSKPEGKPKEHPPRGNGNQPPLQALSGKPDLKILSMTVIPVGGQPSENIGLGFSGNLVITIQNNSSIESGAFDLIAHPVSNAALNCNDTSSFTVNTSLGAFATETHTFTFTPPPHGNFTARTMVDSGCVVTEYNENNNKSSVSYNVVRANLRLVNSGMTVTPVGGMPGDSGGAGAPAEITVTFTNDSSIAVVSPFRLDVFPISTTSVNCGSTSSITAAFSGMGSFATETRTFTFTLPDHGNYTARAMVDSHCAINERNENDNNASTGHVVVRPNLRMLGMTVTPVGGSPGDYGGAGDPAEIVVTFTNNSSIAAANYRLDAFPVYNNTSINCGDTSSFSATFSLTLGFVTETRTFTFNLPRGGNGYEARAMVDSGCTVTESNENDNKETTTYHVAKPDLRVVGMTVTVQGSGAINYGGEGQPGTVTVTFTNTSSIEAKNFDLVMFPISSTSVNCGSTSSLTVSIPSLAGFATRTQSFSFTVPPSSGVYESRVMVDSQCTVDEMDENDNKMTRSYVVTRVTQVEWRPVVASDGTSNFFLNTNPAENGDGDIIFPDRNTPTGPLHNEIALRIRINFDVPSGGSLTVWYRIFDVDDPTQNFIAGGNPADSLDADAATDPAPFRGGDNRDSAGGTGHGFATEAQVGSLTIAASSTSITSNSLTITFRQPGNNWKAVAGFSAADVSPPVLVLNEAIANGQSGTQSFFRNGSTLAGNYESPLLSVWRKLNVEVDSMATVTGNSVSGHITAVAANAASVTVDVNFRTLDGSRDLNSAPVADNGRLENGTITVGPRNSLLTGNGNNFLEGAAAGGIIAVPFTMVDANSTNFVAGTVTQMTTTGGGLQNLVQLSRPVNFGSYNGGTIAIGAGTPVGIVSNGMTTVLTVSLADVPFSVHDDDDDALLPRNPDTSDLARAFAPAYVVPVFNLTNSTSIAPFVPNVENNPADYPATIQATFRFDNVGTEAAQDFWTVYLLGAFQFDRIMDGDPDRESSVFGTVDDLRGQGADIFLETLRETPVTAFVSEAFTVSHEVGHLFGGSHDAVNGFDGGLMDQSSIRASVDFTPTTINKIRRILHP